MRWINAIGFQVGWWACIASVSRGLETQAIAFCVVMAVAHLALSTAPGHELKLAVAALLLGVLVDSTLQALAVIRFHGQAIEPLSPFWLWALWGLFALTLNASLGFLQTMRPVVSMAAGLIFGPLTYLAGARLGAAELQPTVSHTLSLGLAWMLSLPLMVWLARKYFSIPPGTP